MKNNYRRLVYCALRLTGIGEKYELFLTAKNTKDYAEDAEGAFHIGRLA